MKAAEGCLGALGSFFLRFFLPSAASPPSSAWAALGLLGALGVLAAPSLAGLGVLGALGFGFGFGCRHMLPQALGLISRHQPDTGVAYVHKDAMDARGTV